MSEQELEQILKLVSEDGNNISKIDEKYLSNKEVIKLALTKKEGKKRFDYFQLIPSEMYRDKEILDLADQAQCGGGSTYGFLPEDMKSDPEIIKRYRVDEAIVTYRWYYGFYTPKERKEISKALETHDYDTFMKYFKSKGRGLKRTGWLFLEDDYIFLDLVDITIKDNFMKIKDVETQAG